MAFSTSNVQRSVFGNLKITYGDWTGLVGDAPGTFAVEGGRVYFANFDGQVANQSPTQDVASTTIAAAVGNTSTITVLYHEAITVGRFIIIHS